MTLCTHHYRGKKMAADPNMPVPADFEDEQREIFFRKIEAKFTGHPLWWAEFVPGMGGLLYRVTACADHDDAFTNSFLRYGTPPMPERYYQERDLFDFFVTGQSALECLCYALYALGEMIEPTSFTLFTAGDQRKINPKLTAEAFSESNFKSVPLTANLAGVTGSTQYKEWKKTRDVLIHRLHGGRQHNVVANGGPQSTHWMGFSIDAKTTHSRRLWLMEQLNSLLRDANAFADAIP